MGTFSCGLLGGSSLTIRGIQAWRKKGTPGFEAKQQRLVVSTLKNTVNRHTRTHTYIYVCIIHQDMEQGKHTSD